MIERAIKILQKAGFDFTARELAEIFWLAVHLDEEEQNTSQVKQQVDNKQNPPQLQQPVVDKANSPPPQQPVEHKQESTPKTQPQIQPPPQNLPLSLPETQRPTPKPKSNLTTPIQKGVSIQIPAAPALRNTLELGRALRPLMRKVASPTEQVLDEEATVYQIAEQNIWVPVFQPKPQRWLELALVVEKSNSIAVWKPTIRELEKLLKHHGAFRDVRTWELKVIPTALEPTFSLLPLKLSSQSSRNQSNSRDNNSTSYSPDILIDPKGKRLILLVSDCISTAWRDKWIHPVLNLWGNKSLLAILQLLPEQLWERTALSSQTPVQLSSLKPGVLNSQLIATIWDEDDIEDCSFEQNNGENSTFTQSISIPIITLEPQPLLTWSRVIAGFGNITTAGFKFSLSELEKDFSYNSETNTNQTNTNQQTQLSADALVNRFRATASPTARRLAGLMAAAPVSLPVVQLIQQTLLPNSRQIHAAEVFMSGLLKSITPQNTQVDYIEYEFIPGVRELLVDSVPKSKTISVIDAVSEYIAKRLGLSVREFEAQLLFPSEGDVNLASKIHPFAQIKAQVLRRLGGIYTEIAQDLEQIYQLETELFSAVGVDYSRLRDLLEAQKWKEANALMVSLMLQVAGQENKGYLEAEDIKKFPCEDLRTINQLWLRNSKERFGFSVQKNIYGRKNQYNQQNWIRFGNRVGWLRNDEWIDDEADFTFSPYAPKGHLPIWVSLFRLDFPGYRKGRITSFLSKIETCIIRNLSPNTSIYLSDFTFEVVTVNPSGKIINRKRKQAQYFNEKLPNNIALEMVYVPNGKFMMGSPEGEGLNSEKPQHQVTIQSFFMSKYQVTQAQWKAVANLPQVKRKLQPEPSNFKGNDRPVESISWYDAVEFCTRLSNHTGREYRLPSEAEWEYACRAGTTTRFHFGDIITTKLANFQSNVGKSVLLLIPFAGKGTTPVGDFDVANAFGLYDMHGNVWEWCLDDSHGSYKGAPIDGNAWLHKNDNLFLARGRAIIRGGSWSNNPNNCRSAYCNSRDRSAGRNYVVNNIGFRVVCAFEG
ncbi:MAG: SAV_2336 N-terminal domain-related protein [Cyanobacteria bacterium J06639_18]